MSRVSEVTHELRHALIPAVPVPFRADRTIDRASHVRMAEYLNSAGVGGVAVWAHTGRGLMLTYDERAAVMEHWRESMPDKIVIAGVGCPATPDVGDDRTYIDRAARMAEHARDLGADALLAYAPARFRSGEVPDAALVAEYHEAIAAAGLPVILFYLYHDAGGISYSDDLLRQLLAKPSVIGMKIATLDSVMTYQRLIALMKSDFPNKLCITGEDRFFGYSLMMGADAALIGMGSALTAMQADLIRAWKTQDLDRFAFLNRIVDHFAQTTFVAPMDGYIARMLYVLSHLGIVAPDSMNDPWGPAIEPAQLEAIDRFLHTLPQELR